MKNSIFRSKKFYLSLIIIIAASGSIFFFPMNIGEQYTCFYHRLFDPPQSDVTLDASIDNQDNISNQATHSNLSQHHSVLLDKYLDQYAFIWWSSVALLALCVYLFFKLKRNVVVNESSLTLE